MTCRQRQTERLVDWLGKRPEPRTIRQAAAALRFSVRHIHSLALDCEEITVNVAYRVGNSIGRIERVSDYILELNPGEE